MNKEEIIKEVIAILETSDYVDSSEHLYDGIKQIKREITYSTIHDFLWALESPTVLDVDGKVALCAKKIKLLLKQELLDEAYENFSNKAKGLNLYLEVNKDIVVPEGPVYNAHARLLTQEEFINKCKTNPEFSEHWGLRIEERELSLEERKIHMSKYSNDRIYPDWDEKFLNEKGIPTKLITITYNDKTIESYE